MNRLFLMVGLLLILVIPQASAAITTQYPNPNRQTMWNSITDSVHTLGQNPQQKQATIKKLHNARTRTRLRSISQANRAKFLAKRKAWLKSQQIQQ